MNRYQVVANEICKDYWAEWEECIKYTDKLQERIATALQEAENFGLEKAAKIADEFFDDYKQSAKESRGHMQSGDMGACDAADDIAEAIRALKGAS